MINHNKNTQREAKDRRRDRLASTRTKNRVERLMSRSCLSIQESFSSEASNEEKHHVYVQSLSSYGAVGFRRSCLNIK